MAVNRQAMAAMIAAIVLMFSGAVGYRVFARRLLVPLPAPRMAREVPVRYYLSLPRGWRPGGSYPIVVPSEGVGHDFAGTFQSFVAARGDRPFIIVTPFVRSNGNDLADMRATLAIVREVQQDDGGQPKFFITGFSAGGHMAWQVILRHPELLAGAVLSAGNFGARDMRHFSSASERGELPIQAFQGTFDPHLAMMNGQWTTAERTARAHGFTNINRTMVSGAGHSAFPEQALDFFYSRWCQEQSAISVSP